MATSLAATLNLVLSTTFSNALDLATPAENMRLAKTDTLANGTVIDLANEMWHDTRTLTATSENLDLYGSLTNIFGETLNFNDIVCILIHNKSTTVGANLIIGGAAANAFPLFTDTSDKYPIGPNGIFLVWEPSAVAKSVTSGTGDILKIDSGAATISYDIVVIGRD